MRYKHEVMVYKDWNNKHHDRAQFLCESISTHDPYQGATWAETTVETGQAVRHKRPGSNKEELEGVGNN